MMKTVLPRTWVPGTPRGFGDNKVASEWLNELAAGLAPHRDVGRAVDPDIVQYDVVLEFRVFPGSQKYRGQNMPHGTDLDNLVKQTLDGLSHTRSKDLPPGLNIITDDKVVYRITATKERVQSDDETGVRVAVEIM